MKILFVIPHYYNPEGNGRYGSTRNNTAGRVNALTDCISSIYQSFGDKQFFLDISKLSAEKTVDFQRSEIRIVILTTQNKHILNSLNVNSELYIHKEVETEPMMIGFEAKKIFAENIGKYDYYCYLEDDLTISDTWFFSKLKWFNSLTSDNYLLQPNRYEVSTGKTADKVYIDGNIRIQATEKFQNVNDTQTLTASIMGEQVLFKRTLNPHSGCYFLNRNQLEILMNQSYFKDNDTSFVGPLESAATLGIMKTFKVYKPEPQNFLEVVHYGTSFLGLLGNKVKIVEEQVSK